MLGLLKSIYLFLWLYLMRRREFDNQKLRQFFEKNYDIEVGLYSYGCFDRWRMPGPMRVGRYSSIAKTVRAVPDNHPIEALTTHPFMYDKAFGVIDTDGDRAPPLIIEDDVWIGHNAIILPGCKLIGRGAVIGAGAIVTKNVDRYTVVAGNPARKLRDRFAPDLQAALELSRWWELDLAAFRTLARDEADLLHRPSAISVLAFADRRKLT